MRSELEVKIRSKDILFCAWVCCSEQNEMVMRKEGKILEFCAMSDWVGALEVKKGKYRNSEQ